MRISQATWRRWGLLSNNYMRDAAVYFLLIAAFFLISSFAISRSGYLDKFLVLWSSLYRPLWLVFPVSIFQEVIFRGWLMPVLREKFHKFLFVVLINAVLFATTHLVFPYREIMVPGAFLVGLGFATIYYFFPNLILASIAHMSFNLLVIPYCLWGCR